MILILISLQKTMNQAKRMKVEDDEELTSGSSSEDELQVLDDSEVLNVEFEGKILAKVL